MNRCKTACLMAVPLVLLFVATFGAVTPGVAADPDFVVWQAYNVKFMSDQSGVTLLASIYVLNPTRKDYRDLVFTGLAPEGFTLFMAAKEIQEASRRPQGFSEGIEDGAYVMKQPFLGATQATTIFFELHWKKPPAEFTEFPGLRVNYKVGEETRQFQVPGEENSMARIRRFSGDIGDYIKHIAGITLSLDKASEPTEWTFTALDYRAFGRNPIGIIDSEGSPEGSGHFRVQTGYPGDFREILVRWVAKNRGRKEPLTGEIVRKEMETMIRWLGDLSVDADSVKVTEPKIARYPGVLLEGRWVDNKPIRLGSGLFRFYAVNDPRSDRDFFIYLGVQGRGIGPENADKPADEKEMALMESLLPYIEKFRP